MLNLPLTANQRATGCLPPQLAACYKPLQQPQKLIPIRTNLFGLHYKPIQSGSHALLFHLSPQAESGSSRCGSITERDMQPHFLQDVCVFVFFGVVLQQFAFFKQTKKDKVLFTVGYVPVEGDFHV